MDENYNGMNQQPGDDGEQPTQKRPPMPEELGDTRVAPQASAAAPSASGAPSSKGPRHHHPGVRAVLLGVAGGVVGAVLAINADDYGTHNYGIIIRDGSRIRANSTTRHLVAVLPDGSLEMVGDHSRDNAKAVAERLEKENVMHTFEFGPILVQDGAAVSFPKSFDVISTRDSRREPRTGIGLIDPLLYVLIVVDGRQPGYSDGISLQSLQALFVSLGATNAINLDGGGSTEMWFQGVILNEPAGGTERELSDCIYF